MIRINILNKGDDVLNVTDEFIVVKRKKGEVEIIPLLKDCYPWRIDTENVIHISYGHNTVTENLEEGISITNF